ncbi:MAG: (2Fe-2S)-binding protein [Deltaproteobacteria bacterium]|nr:MAG: (2Fe-2S)-binding protein [Deltaproteobacteria bacterium]
MSTFTVHFPAEPDCPPVTLPLGSRLSEHLTASNSPLLFGCRTGLCATCLVIAEGEVEPMNEDEREIVEIWAEDDPRARLACQLVCTGDVRLTPHPEAP